MPAVELTSSCPTRPHQLAASQAIAAATKVRSLQDSQGKRYYWLHSLILTVLTGFGGGILAPLLIGKPPLIFQNDLIVPFCTLFWYLCHTLPGVQAVLTTTLAKVVWGVFNGLFRTYTVCNIVKVASDVLVAGPYYPHALVGPILAGTILGAGSQFMPLDKGLSAVTNGASWPMQAAFMTSVTFYFEVCDKSGQLGTIFRSVFGTHDEATVRAVIATVHVATILAQVLFDESANFFTPVHKLLYLVFQVTGPANQEQLPDKTVGWDIKTRIILERSIEVGRVVIVIAIIAVHLALAYPSSALLPGMRLAPGGHIGVCHLPSLSNCSPASLSFYSLPGGSFRLAAYPGKASAQPPAAAGQTTWSASFSARLADGEKASAVISDDGVLHVVATTTGASERELWSSSAAAKCKPSSAGGAKAKLTLEDAKPVVVCGGGDKVAFK